MRIEMQEKRESTGVKKFLQRDDVKRKLRAASNDAREGVREAETAVGSAQAQRRGRARGRDADRSEKVSE